MRNIFRCLTLGALLLQTPLHASFESVKPHAHRTTPTSVQLPKNKDARALMTALTKTHASNVILNETELRTLGITGGQAALPGMTIEEVLPDGPGKEYSLFLLPGELGFGALLKGPGCQQIFKFDRELKCIAGWTRNIDGSFVPLTRKMAEQKALECLAQWKTTISE